MASHYSRGPSRRRWQGATGQLTVMASGTPDAFTNGAHALDRMRAETSSNWRTAAGPASAHEAPLNQLLPVCISPHGRGAVTFA